MLCRLVANAIIPLNDTTEARYAEIARMMLATGDWVTLQQEHGIPFWAKPPLSTWLSAGSMQLFGINEFAVRFPSLLLSIAVLALVWKLAKEQMNRIAARIAVVVLAASFYFFLNAGAVMTESALLFCLTLSLVAFWLAVVKEQAVWPYLFFVGLGLGLLAKGPILLVLLGIPLLLWVVVNRAWIIVWQRLPWITGIVLMCLISLPWYVLAEHRTPGFLNYFVVGEHIQRFVTPGWAGDKYGVAHYAPKGMIWGYALLGLLPWVAPLTFWLIKYRKTLFLAHNNSGWLSYLILNTLVPLLFFTLASNIIYPYVFPILPAFALLFTEFWKRRAISLARSLWIPHCALITGIGCVVVILVFCINPTAVSKTQKPVIDAWLQQQPSVASSLIYWTNSIDLSAQFYSQGKAKAVTSLYELCHMVPQGDFFLVVNVAYLEALPRNLRAYLQLRTTLSLRKNNILLFYGAPVNVKPVYC